MKGVEEYLSDNFKKRSMGIVCDFAKEIDKVYTAVFPTKEILKKVMDYGAKNAMLFLHHPCIWDIRKAPKVFYQMDIDMLEKFKKSRVSIYNLYVPLDNHSEYSTSNTLVKALDIEVIEPFAHYSGAINGVIGTTKCVNLIDLNKKLSSALGHQTKCYSYGDSNIKDGKVAVIAGGGNDIIFLKEMVENGVRVLITGISSENDRYAKIYEFEIENNISLLGGTHYSTEKFAYIKMCNYFEQFGLKSEFIEGEAIYEDM